MAVGRKLRRPVSKGAFITAEAVEPASDSVLWRLRARAGCAVLEILIGAAGRRSR
jgi:predicted homoserine dehydrogenase-like protein